MAHPIDKVRALLRSAPWLRAPQTQAVFAALNAQGYDARVVGGAVRNTLMDLPVSDIDIATTAVPEETIAAAERADLKVFTTGLQHGTVTILSDGIAHEVTTLRSDVETDGRHAQIAFTTDWCVDARRRDFTMNALYCDAGGTLFDPLNGLDDVLARRVRFIDDPKDRIREDYLRILRFFRFNAQYGDMVSGFPDQRGHVAVDMQGLQACILEQAGLAHLSAERVRVEMMKLLGAPCGFRVCQLMYDTGFLPAILGVVPRITSLRRLVELEQSLGRACDPLLRLTALCVAVSEDVEKLAHRLRMSAADKRVLAYAGDIDAPGAPIKRHLNEEDAKRLLYRWGVEKYKHCVLLAWANHGLLDTAEDGFNVWRSLYDLPAHWAVPVCPVSGGDLLEMGLKAGPEVGKCLRIFENWWIAHNFPQDKAAHSAALKQIVAQSLMS